MRNRVKYAGLLSLACVCVIQLQPAQSAHASDSTHQLKSSRAVRAHAEFRARGANGFRIYVTGTPGGVRLVASRRHEAAVYLDRLGVADQNQMHANFGRLGKITLRFHPLRKARRTFERPAGWTRCEWKPRDQYGYFTGTVAFHGEEGFTALRKHKVYGRAAPAQRLKCITRSAGTSNGSVSKSNPNSQSELSITSLYPLRLFIAGGEAISGIRALVRGGVSLNLATLPRTGVPFRAESIQEISRGRVVIIRLLVAKGPWDSLMIDANQNVTVTPPSPFSGKVVYRRCAPRSSMTWSGSLRVSLPGLSNKAFAGRKGFTADLKPGGRCQPVR